MGGQGPALARLPTLRSARRVSCWRPACLCTAWHDLIFMPILPQQHWLVKPFSLLHPSTSQLRASIARIPRAHATPHTLCKHRYALCIACAAETHTGSKKLHVFCFSLDRRPDWPDGRGSADSHAADADAMPPERLELALDASAVPVRRVLLRGRMQRPEGKTPGASPTAGAAPISDALAGVRMRPISMVGRERHHAA